MKAVLLAIAMLLIFCVCGSPASAQEEDQVVAPPGNSGVEEYLEIVPGAGGDRPAGGGSQAPETSSDAADSRATPRDVLGAQTARELGRLGEDGRAAAEVAAAGVPAEAGTTTRGAETKRPNGQSQPNAAAAAEDTGGRAEAVAGALAGTGGGMGLAFPLLLLGALAAALGLLAVRRIARSE